jgi:hypothetical protein
MRAISFGCGVSWAPEFVCLQVGSVGPGLPGTKVPAQARERHQSDGTFSGSEQGTGGGHLPSVRVAVMRVGIRYGDDRYLGV